jgi:hypothetical protein
MITVCMYCQITIKPEDGKAQKSVSHGVCKKCCKENHPETYEKILKKNNGVWPY